MINRNISLNWLAVAVGVTLLALAASAQPVTHWLPNENVQDTNWYFNYELGYIHRGVMGSLFQLFNGAPDYYDIHRTVPVWDSNTMIAVVIIAATMMFYPILRLRVTGERRALLMAFAALLLLAPVWKAQAHFTGGMDKYVFICALAATAALMRRRWALMVMASALGLLIHPKMIFFSAIVGALALHALLFRPPWRRRYKVWLASALAPLLIALFLYAISAPEKNVALLEKYGFPHKATLDNARLDFLSPAYNINRILGHLYAFPRQYLTLFVFYVIAPYCIACAVARLLRKNAIVPAAAATCAGARLPATVKGAVAFFARYDVYILFAAGVFVFLPVTIVHLDIDRILHWSQWGMMLVYIYLLSCAGGANAAPGEDAPAAGAGDAGGGDKQRGKGAATIAPAIALALAAYTFAGAPLVASPPGIPRLYACNNVCIPALTDENPAGNLFSRAIFAALKNSILPMEIGGKIIWRYNYFVYNERARNRGILGKAPDDGSRGPSRRLDLNGDVLVVDEHQVGAAVGIPTFMLGEDEQIHVRVTYKAAAPPPLRLCPWGGRLHAPLVSATDTEMVWQFTSPATEDFVSSLHTTGGVAFEVSRVRVEKISPPAPPLSPPGAAPPHKICDIKWYGDEYDRR